MANKYKEYYKGEIVLREPIVWDLNFDTIIFDLGHNFKTIKKLFFSTNKKIFLETDDYILAFFKITSSGLPNNPMWKNNKRIQVSNKIYNTLLNYSIKTNKKLLILGVYDSFERYTYIVYDNTYFNLNNIITTNSLWIDFGIFYVCVSNKKLIHEKVTSGKYLIYSFTCESSADFFNNIFIEEIFNNFTINSKLINEEIIYLCKENNIKELIGFVGEYIINNKLQKSKFSDQYIWNRQIGNIWANHDFSIEKKLNEKIIYDYIEVKTYINIKKPHFFLSKNEYDFILKNKNNYKVYLVWFSNELLSKLMKANNKLEFIDKEVILNKKYKIIEFKNIDELFSNNYYSFETMEYLWSSKIDLNN